MPFIFLDAIDEPFYPKDFYLSKSQAKIVLSENFPIFKEVLKDLNKYETGFFIDYLISTQK
jgi:hypothetical protein